MYINKFSPIFFWGVLRVPPNMRTNRLFFFKTFQPLHRVLRVDKVWMLKQKSKSCVMWWRMGSAERGHTLCWKTRRKLKTWDVYLGFLMIYIKVYNCVYIYISLYTYIYIYQCKPNVNHSPAWRRFFFGGKDKLKAMTLDGIAWTWTLQFTEEKLVPVPMWPLLPVSYSWP